DHGPGDHRAAVVAHDNGAAGAVIADDGRGGGRNAGARLRLGSSESDKANEGGGRNGQQGFHITSKISGVTARCRSGSSRNGGSADVMMVTSGTLRPHRDVIERFPQSAEGGQPVRLPALLTSHDEGGWTSWGRPVLPGASETGCASISVAATRR